MSSKQARLPLGEEVPQSVPRSTEEFTPPESPPDALLAEQLPHVSDRSEIAPKHDGCTVQNGDLLACHVGTEEMEWYGFLVLDTYGLNKLVGLSLPAYQYGDRELEGYVDWIDQHGGEDHTLIYKDVAPVLDKNTDDLDKQQ